MFNLSKTKSKSALYKESVRAARKMLSTTVIKTCHTAKVAVCSEIPTKHLTQSEQNVEFFNVNVNGTYRNRWALNG
jgi:hypothetical protein